MMSLLYPDLLKNRIEDITEEDLQGFGARGLLLDVDNTLTMHRSQSLDSAVADWVLRMRDHGFALMIVSNASAARVEPFAARIGLPFLSFACKPFPFGFQRAAKKLGLSRRQCVVIGDQTFTDVWGARAGGFRVIQLLPIRREHQPLMRFKRWLERPILRRYRNQTEKRRRP